MKIQFKNNYTKNGKDMFVYSVHGTDTELEQYNDSKGEYLVTDDETGSPLFFSSNYVGEQGSLIFTSKGNAIVDMAEFKKAHSLAKQFGGSLGMEIASVMTAKLLGSSAPIKSTVKVEEAVEDDKLDS